MSPLIKKIWFFIWKDNSLLSWIVSIILAFIIVKFLIYPGLGLAFGTKYPIVAVVSNSMDHDGLNFDTWWNEKKTFYLDYGITKQEFESYPFYNGFNKGDIMVLIGYKKPEKGDIVVYASSRHEYPIIHRLITAPPYQTKGDRNDLMDPEIITSEKLFGRAIFKVPYLGWIKIWFTDLTNVIRGG